MHGHARQLCIKTVGHNSAADLLSVSRQHHAASPLTLYAKGFEQRMLQVLAVPCSVSTPCLLTTKLLPVRRRMPSAVVSHVRLKATFAHWPPTAAVVLTLSAAL